jgi:acetylornithine deacetylase/succinyl-diaminopimelate desuccinylase-like protein
MEEALKLLEKLVSFESISTDSRKEKEIKALLDFLKNFLEKENFKIRIIGTKKPLFIAQKFISNKAKTIGVYAHYDVQPAEPLNEWQTDPFRLTIKNNKIYARGVADDKGHLVQNVFSVLKLLKENNLKNNIIFIFEGEEETGSNNLARYLDNVKDILKNVDFYILTDAGMARRNFPTIYYALRGIVYFELEVWTGKKDLHSGVYGNLVYNPAQIISKLFSEMKDINGKIKIPKFYQKVRKISEKEKRMLWENTMNFTEIKEITETFALNPLDKKHPSISAKIYPSMEINGLYSGYINEGSKTIIPNYALAKFSFRLVEYQEPNEIINLVKKFVKDNIPNGVKYNLKVLASAKPFYCDFNNYYLQNVAKILESHFKNKCIFQREGGSIPVAEILMTKFKKPVIITGFTLPGSNIHAPNENIDYNLFFEGIKALKKIYSFEF